MEGTGTCTFPFITDRYHLTTVTLTTPTSSLGECNDLSFFVICSVSFLSKLIRTGGKRPLTVEDLGAVGKDYKASTLYDAYSREWAKEQEKKQNGKNPSFIKAMVRATGLCYWVTGVILILLGCLLGFVPTILLNLLVSDFESDEPSPSLLLSSLVDYKMRWVYAGLLLVAPLIAAFINSIVQMMMTKIAISLKCMASEAIYRKALKLTSTAKGDISTGQLVNIMSTDTNVLLQFVMIVNIIAMIPIMVFSFSFLHA